MAFSEQYILESIKILNTLSFLALENMAIAMSYTRDMGGRLFILGVGGSAGTASHAVNDFRKICKIDAFTPTDNVSELTARINDEGWENSYANWLKQFKLTPNDLVLVLSVGGGNRDKQVSTNLIKAIDYVSEKHAGILSIVGRDGGYAAKKSYLSVVIPPLNDDLITPHTEGLTSVLLHLLVSHPMLQKNKTKWESIT